MKKEENMIPVEYVNVNGTTILLEDIETVKRPPKEMKGPRHLGWAAIGVSPERVKQEQNEMKALKKAFDLEAFLRKATPKPIRSKPYNHPDSAAVACTIARKAGWLNCHVIEKKYE